MNDYFFNITDNKINIIYSYHSSLRSLVICNVKRYILFPKWWKKRMQNKIPFIRLFIFGGFYCDHFHFAKKSIRRNYVSYCLLYFLSRKNDLRKWKKVTYWCIYHIFSNFVIREKKNLDIRYIWYSITAALYRFYLHLVDHVPPKANCFAPGTASFFGKSLGMDWRWSMIMVVREVIVKSLG